MKSSFTSGKYSKTISKSILIITFIALVTGLGAAAETLTVDAGSGSSDGDPYATIQGAIDAAESDDTIVVEEYSEGNYDGFDVTKEITVTAAEDQNPLIQDANPGEGDIVSVQSSGAEVSGLTVDGEEQVAVGISARNLGTVDETVNINSNTVRGVSYAIQSGSSMSDGSADPAVNISYNVVGTENEPVTVGISALADDVTISDNTLNVQDNGWGFELFGTQLDLSSNEINGLDTEESGKSTPSAVFIGTAVGDTEVESLTDTSVEGFETGATVRSGVESINEFSERLKQANYLLEHNEQFDAVSVASNTYTRDIENSGTYYSSIQSAVHAASEEDTIEVESGKYEERLSIDVKDLVLEGPNAETSGSGDRSDEAVIASDTGDSGQIEVLAEDVTIRGFEIGGDQSQFGVVPYADGFTSEKNIFKDATTGIWLQNWEYDKFSDKGQSAPENVVVTDNKFVGLQAGVGGIEGSTNVDFNSNTFEDNGEAVGVGSGSADFADQEGLAKVEKSYTAYYDTIQKAVDSATADQVVEVLSGTYEEEVIVDESGLTIRPVDGENPVVESSKTPFTVKSDRVTIQDMTVTGEENSGNGIEVRPQLDNVDITGNTIKNLKRAVLIGLQDLNNAASVEIDDNTIRNNEFGVAQANTDSVSIVDNTFKENNVEAIGSAPVDGSPEIKRNSFLGNGVGVKYYGVEGETNVAVDATQNYWGQESGPEESQIEGDVEYTPWMLTEEGEYDQLESVPAGTWTPVSAEASSEDTEIAQLRESGEEQKVSYSEGEWTQADSVPTDAALRSFYVKTENKATVGFDHESEGDNPENIRSAELSEGWNTIGVATSEDETVSDQLSVIQGALNTLFIPDQGTKLPSEKLIDGSSLPGGTLNEDDGYWVNLQENKVYSVLG